MSAEAFERYREALREGHLAAQRGDAAGAVAAFQQAVALASDRPLPHAGLGDALRRLGRLDEALAAFDRALHLAPLDEGALRGRAATLVALGRHGEAAAALTSLAESVEADNRPAEALELAREALALDSTPARFRLVARLSAAARESSDSGQLDGAAARTPPRPPGLGRAGADGSRSRPVGATLAAEADALVDAGRIAEARDRYLLAARALREGGRLLAALDACHLALAIAPADPELHLVLAELYEDRGWSAQAADKLVLLARLLDLEGDPVARERLCELIGRRFPADARLTALCA